MNRLRTSSGRAPLRVHRRVSERNMHLAVQRIIYNLNLASEYFKPMVEYHQKDVALCSPKKR